MKNNRTHIKTILLPLWGIILFIILYIVATCFYPGGSFVDKTSTGFSWQHNYWCELMAVQAKNGEPNTARPVAMSAMIVLIISLIIFWNKIPSLFIDNKKNGSLIRFCGISSMLVVPLMFVGLHDIAMNIAGALGATAILLLLAKLFTHRYSLFFTHGIICILLCGLNNYVYYSGYFFYYLPIIQKITFLICLSWFALLSLKGYHQVRSPKLQGNGEKS